MQKYTLIKLLGLSLLVMIVLVFISIVEVAIYSYLINPGQAERVYDAHAQFSAPYISGFFGFIVFFLIVRYWKKKNYSNVSRLSILFPMVYVLLDIIVISAAAFNEWGDFFVIFLIANTAKFLGSYLGNILTKSPGA